MKCPSCGHNHRAREGKRCGQCRYQFVFEKGEPLRDNQFMNVVKALSDNGRLAFTRHQLAFAVVRNINLRGCLPFILGCVAAIVTLFAVAPLNIPPWFPALGVGVLVGIAVLLFWPSSRGDLRQALRLVERYHRQHPLKEMATGGAFAHPDPATRMEAGYAPERVLVVQQEDLVDALIYSGFHREQRCVVLSVDGYPEHVFAACREFVKRHPQLPFYLLHDAALINEDLLARLQDRPEWTFAREQLRELGINREQLSGAESRKLPWLLRDGKTVFTTAQHRKMLDSHARLLVDYASPATLHGALASALVAGMLLLPTPAPAGDTGGPDGGSG